MNNIIEELNKERQEHQAKKTEYLEYLYNHKLNVIKTFDEYIQPLVLDNPSNELKEAIMLAGRHIQDHDASKYSYEEFEPYRYHFYPTELEKSDKNYTKYDNRMFPKAVEHHYKNNPHHIYYWKDGNPSLDYILEMLCDWFSVGRFFHSSTLDWYTNEADKEKSAMSYETRKTIEDLLFNKIKGEPWKE